MLKSERKAIWYIGVGVLALIGAVQFNFGGNENPVDNSSYELSDADLSSISNSKASRDTELGKAVPSEKNKKDKDFDVLLEADPAMSQKWDLHQTQTPEAWSRLRSFGSRDVKVCIIDTGCDVNHPNLKENIWTNPGETGKDALGRDKATNQIDDDNDGCVDDVHGCNFVANNNDLTDRHGHGTHIAGIIGAVGGKGIGISGVSPRVSMIIAKYYDPNSPANNNLLNTIRAIRYCVAVGANIINYSGGGLEPSDVEHDAIALAREKGILFVAAAGNEQSNSDVKKYYPADYDLDNIISVTALDREKNVLPSSNYGAHSVDIAAPGKNIYSTLPNGNYGFMTGTSQATGVVTGVAALIKSRFSDFDAHRIIRHITETGDYEPVKLNGKTRNEKRLNAYRALAILDQGVTVTGIVPKNAVNLDASQFSVSSREPSYDPTSPSQAAPEGLTSFGLELQKMLLEQQSHRPR